MKYLLKEDSKVTPVSGRSTFNALEKYNLISVQSELLFANTLPRSAQTVQIVAVQNSFQVPVNCKSCFLLNYLVSLWSSDLLKLNFLSNILGSPSKCRIGQISYL